MLSSIKYPNHPFIALLKQHVYTSLNPMPDPAIDPSLEDSGFEECNRIMNPPRIEHRVVSIRCKQNLFARYVVLYKKTEEDSVLALSDIQVQTFGNDLGIAF